MMADIEAKTCSC